MAKLIITLDGKNQSEYELNSETTTIGRHKNNDIQIDNLSVSGHHSKILNIADDFFIEDMGSSNGTFVNSNLIKKYALKDGDEIKIGKHHLRYVKEVNITDTDEDEFEKTMIIRPDSAGMPTSAADAEMDKKMGKIAANLANEDKTSNTAHKKVGNASLQLLSGTNAGKKLPLTKILTTLGKPGVQVAAITKRPTGYYILHVEGGANSGQPTVNGENVGSKASPLNNNDIIEVAGIKMEFNIS